MFVETEHCHRVSDKFCPVGFRPDVTARNGEPTDGDFRTHWMKLSIAIR